MRGTPRSPRKAAALYVGFLLLLLAAGLLAAEGVLRRQGHVPFVTEPPTRIQVEPGGRKHQADERLGYRNLPGRYRITLDERFTYTTTHAADTLRITRPEDVRGGGRPGLWIFGDSFTYGAGLDDHETYPWLLQERYPGHDVVNFGVDGYGTVQALLQIRERLGASPPPRLILVAYASFHGDRNALTRAVRKSRAQHSFLGPVALPYAEVDADGTLRIRSADLASGAAWPLARRWALVNFLHDRFNALRDRSADREAVTRAVLSEIAAIGRRHDIQVVVANLWRPPDAIEAFCREASIPWVDVSLDLKLPENNNLPFESHPSAYANLVLADRLAAFLEEKRLLGPAPETRPLPAGERARRILGFSRASFLRGQFARSARLSERALEATPDSATAYSNLCAAQAKLGEHARAVESCRRALRIDPELAEARRNLTWLEEQRP